MQARLVSILTWLLAAPTTIGTGQKASSSTPLLPRDAPIVDVGTGKYQGAYNATTNVTSYWGIRFAASPTGDLRWRAPQTPQTLDGIQLADTPPQACPQPPPDSSTANTIMKRQSSDPEDCLFLNVFIPGEAVQEGLPVVVYIHGGAYAIGSTSGFPGSDLVVDSHNNVVAVTIQYRLSMFGFLAGQAVKDGGTLNAGLLDQDFALRWVQEHIASFGGDPSKVTIWGKSAGAGSVLMHLVANGGKTEPQLFRGAMTSSTCLDSQFKWDDPYYEARYAEAISQANCAGTVDTLSCLRNTDYDILEAINSNITSSVFFGGLAFSPIIDGDFITQSPSLSIAEGKVNGEALLAVTNSFEGTVFVPDIFDSLYDLESYAGQQWPKMTEDERVQLASVYENTGTNLEQLRFAFGEAVFICTTYRLLSAYNGTAWKGQFALLPALHGSDVVYYFSGGTLGALPYNNLDFINGFAQSFMSFVISQDPNAKFDDSNIVPDWPLYSESGVEMVFNKTDDDLPEINTRAIDAGLMDRCSHWESLIAPVGQ